MSTLIASNTSTSRRRRRCNAKCYNARGPDCNCLCLGVNHGVGEQQTRANTREMGHTWTQRATRPHSRRRNKFRTPPEQGELFPPVQDAAETPA
jgi:hypothetical protein